LISHNPPPQPEASVAFLSFFAAVVAFDPGVSGRVLRRHRKQIGSKNRALTAGQQALMTLAYLKNAETFAQLGAGFKVGTTTAWRYVNKAVKLLSARSPKLAKALHTAKQAGLTPYKGRDKPESQKMANRSHAKLRGPGERANAQLKTWKILTKLRCCPHRTGHLAKAIHVLQNREASA
jgi:hypothetical protein